MEIIKEKIDQAIDVLNELDIDVWMIFCRESKTTPDPSMELMVGSDVVGQSAFFIHKSGKTVAMVSQYDAADLKRPGCYGEIITYTSEDVGVIITDVLSDLKPRTVALNYSKNSVTADGLTHGMFLKLSEYLKETSFADSLVSSEEILRLVRGRKNSIELDRLKRAATLADECWHKSIGFIKTGMTEIEIAEIITNSILEAGATNSFEPIVNAGTKTTPGHGSPTEAVLEKGDLLHIDFGALVEGYCSDIQRIAYCKKDSESGVPEELKKAFEKVKTIVDVTAQEYKTGALGYDVDALARKMLIEDGYPEFNHCLGHQIGREVHDGSGGPCPDWKRYGNAPFIPMEENNTFTVELGIELSEIGYVALEEDLMVTKNGGIFLGPRQTELVVL